ncbi:HNH endonuclease signature motif containing protein [Paraburkholderia sp. J8-2]|uniref:HNH endonuclease n=1 Tax=Paraburkholderia sp. J8-2 TaxID=2805440 RepID=UPI002AB5EC5B|nr:HNH endonuclease signature motif containing protein [Paraburkholderia sp. J8-2]
MARLTTIKPRLATAPQRAQIIQPGSWRAGKTTAAQRGYGADWQRLRLAHLAANPHCVMCLRDLGMTGLKPAEVVLECARRGIAEPLGNIGDHITPHRGNDALRLDPTNVQTLCKPHHDGEKAADERASGFR